MNIEDQPQINVPGQVIDEVPYHTHDDINTPKLKGQPFGRMTLSANQTLSTNGPVLVTFNTKTFAENVVADTVNSLFKVTTQGKYLIIANLFFGTAADKSCWIYIYKNGAAYEHAISHTGGDNSPISSQITSILSLAKDDYIQIYAGQTFNPTLIDKDNSYFTIVKI